MLSLFAVLVLSGCDSRQPRSIRGKATDFTLRSIDGKDVRLSDFRGKAVMLEFWATWCTTCKKAVPYLVALNDKYKDDDFELIAISLDQSVGDVKKFIRDNNISYTVLMSDRKVEKQYGIVNLPVTFLLDKSGVVVKKHLGIVPEIMEDMEKDLRLLMEGMPLDLSTTESRN